MAAKDYDFIVTAQNLQPYAARKEHLDIDRLNYVFTCYLDDGEVLTRIERIEIYVIPPDPVAAAVILGSPVRRARSRWQQDYPVGFTLAGSLGAVPAGTIAADTFPLVVVSWTIAPDGKGVEVFAAAGTPDLTYVVSFVAVPSVSARHKQVDTLITIEVPVNPLTVGPEAAAAPGDYVTGTGSAVTLSDGVAANVVSLSLGAGDWVVNGSVSFNTGTALIYKLAAGAASSSGVLPAKPLYAQISPGGALSGAEWGLVLPEQRFYLSVPTTVYLVVNAGFGSGSTVTAIGRLSARNWAGVI